MWIKRLLSPSLAAVPWLLLLAGLGLTYVVQDAARESARDALRGEFDFRVDEVAQYIDRRMQSYELVLQGASAFFAASPQVTRKEFAQYVNVLTLERTYPGIQGVGFAKLVPPQEKARHVAAIRAEGFPQYDIRPAGTRETYTSIIYLEPFDWRNQRAFGYDMYSEPVRRQAMERARDAAAAAMSGKVKLVQETERDVQAGFLMYLPVYRNQLRPETVAERRAELVGWVYAPFRMSDLINAMLGRWSREMAGSFDLAIYDGDRVAAESLLFDSYHSLPGDAPVFRVQRTLDVFGRRWTLVAHSLPSFDARLTYDKANIIAVAGAVGSGLLALIVWLLVTARVRAVVMAEGMTTELRQSEARQRRLNRALRLLSDCNTALVHAEDEHRLLAEICRLIVERGSYLMAWVGYADHDAAKTVRPVAESGYEDGYLEQIRVSWADTEEGRGPTGTAIRTGAPDINQNVLTNPRMTPWRKAAVERGYQSSIGLPLISQGQVLGALTIYAREADAFHADEVRLLEELASDLAYGVAVLRMRAEHAAAKEKVDFLAHFDSLTHLPNRLLLRDRFEHAAQVAAAERSFVALLYLDLDNFKQINDSLGHEAGDKMLVLAVGRLQQCIASNDTVSRLSGDEFVVLLTGIRQAAQAADAANRIRDAFAEPVDVNGTLLSASFSIGISLYPDDGEDFDTLLKRADTAVASAKESGRNTYRFYTAEMNADVLERTRLTGGFLNALRNREFRLHYQPQVDIRRRRVIGAEALVRWQHPVDGLLPPGRFISLAEQSGHIIPLGEWVLKEACRQAKAWLDRFPQPLVVAVNLSALQFKHGDVLALVEAALAESGLPAACLELELTESILLQDVAATMQTLRSLKALGVKLSIDDFGTGYSSLAYLKQLAVDKLKIDQSFVRDMLTDADGASIVQAIIQLGHSLQLDVIAEGVETEAQLAFLGGSGCDEGQGYLFSRPVPPEQFAALVEEKGGRL